MLSVAALSGWIVLLTFLSAIILPWARNIRAARASGLPYVVLPFFAYNRVTSILMLRIVLRIANKVLPAQSITSGRSLASGSWPWKLQYAPFAELGDTFLTAAPGGLILNTADADVITQIMTRGFDFPKASHLYKTVNIYGENILAAEGETWRRHRKIMSPLFSEQNNRLVWKQTLECCDVLLGSWTNEANRTVCTLGKDTMKLSLNVIEHAGLGQEVVWPSFAEGQTSTKKDLQDGHAMTFHGSLTAVLDHLLYIILLPKWFLANAPFRGPRQAHQSYRKWGTYMADTIARKRSRMELEMNIPNKSDVLSQLVRASRAESDRKTSATLTESETLGNLFVMVIAGHETSATSIQFSLLLLAMHPRIQTEVQQELDGMFGTRTRSSDWNYERDFQRLLRSKLAAVLSEELRLFPPTVALPKLSTSTPHQIVINGKDTVVPPNTMVRVCVSSVHRNPRFWDKAPPARQTKPGSRLDSNNDLHDFRPDRWMKKGAEASSDIAVDSEAARPYKTGAYIPFSDGPRACIGRRFAQVEILATLARILSQYSIELAVDEWASSQQVAQMTEVEKAKVWEQAAAKATWNLKNKTAVLITLQLRGLDIPVKIVRRGEEVFANQ